MKLKEDFDLEDSTAANALLNIKSYSSETFIRSFQVILLADVTFTNHRLAKISYVPVHHLFYECSLSYRFENNLKTSGLYSQERM